MNAGQACGRQQLREAALRLPGLERDTVQQKPAFRNPQQEPAIAVLGHAQLQLIPGDFELSLSAFVVKTIEADVLYQDIQTVHEGTGRRNPTFLVSVGVCRENMRLLVR